MPFNHSAFRKATLQPRTLQVNVPALKHWFTDDDDPVFTVRGLSASESAFCLDAGRNNDIQEDLVNVMTENQQRQAEIKKAAGIYDQDDMHPDIPVKMQMLVKGCVEPQVEVPDAERIAQEFPQVFEVLVGCIQKLTRAGSEIVKRKPSGETPK